MRIRILFLSLGITLLCILLFSIGSTQVYYNSSITETENALKVYVNAFDGTVYPKDSEGANAFSEKLNGVRVTFMDGNGKVLGDSRAEEIDSDHSDREEVVKAIRDGEGFAVRSSSTLGDNMVYYCKKTADGTLVRLAVSTPSEWTLFARTLPTLAMYIGIDVILCLVLSFVATYFILNPVKTLAGDASMDEVKTKYSELEPITEILNERNRNIKRQMKALEEDKELILEARASKDEFIANVTHEMNTPLTSIRGYAELLENGGLSEKQKTAAYATISAQSERLTNLIACIINYSQIEADDLPSYEVDFSGLAKEIVEALRPEAEKSGVRLIPEIEDNVLVTSRNERVREILGNLTRNAIKYNRPGGTVRIILNHNLLAVEDTGIGIAEENKDKVFSRFFTVDKSHGGKNGGFGLGLAVVKKICQKSGWKISLESTLGVGSKFIIEF